MRTTLWSLLAIVPALLAAPRAGAQQAPPPDPPKAEAPKVEKSKRRDEAPKVRTPDEVEARRRSPFLRPPGGDDHDARYDDDYRDLPPWSRASFFGIAAKGKFFVYVLDQSGSMVDDGRIARATIELRRSVGALQEPQQFEVIFYNDEATAMPGGPIPRTADRRNKEKLRAWLGTVDPDGGTSPRKAVLQALALRPDAVFLLSDGDFPEGTVEAIAKANPRKVPIHCIDLAGGLAGDALPRIASGSGGRYASRPGNLQGTASGR
ncbi:MAG: hypothetical protein BGO49_13220 [Planctomycetales bacterium 71-10]|nr:MAG: hypothetical protein BGO49_13220 [Planctomycetales bacterium 71-10]